MRKLAISAVCAITLAAGAVSANEAMASHDFWHGVGAGIAGGIAAGVTIGIINNAVRAGQEHCHQGYGCHAHGGAAAYHYHDRYGTIIYRQVRQPVYEAPVVVRPGRLPRAHYDWCYSRYRSYDANTNTFKPRNSGGRAFCRSPYGG
jgi:hypothetical protein